MRKTFLPLQVLLFAFVVVFSGCKKEEGAATKTGEKKPERKEMKIIEPLVAGQFYPADPSALREMIDAYFADVHDTPLGPDLFGIISPHAGYVYSGPVAAHVYKNLPKNVYKRVVIVFPSHYKQFRGVLALDADGYRTPLGVVKIDREATEKLIDADPTIEYRDGVYTREHSMEVMLPYLQVTLGDDFKLVALMMGDQSPRMAERLARVLDAQFPGDSTLFVASTDMSHYHPYDQAEILDSRALTDIINLDDLALVDDLRSGRTELCGYGPVLTLIHMAKTRGGLKPKVLDHANSGDTAGDRSRVVGYCSVAFFDRTGESKGGK